MSAENLVAEKSWDTWKERWKSTEENAIDIVKEIFRRGGTQPIDTRKIEEFTILEDALNFAVELGWLKDFLTGSYKVTAVGLLMLAHQVKT